MADADAPGASPTESPAQRQARQRRERRAAKIQAEGASRLQAITSLQGGSHRDVEKDVPAKPAPSPSARPSSNAPGTATPDPEESDISGHHYMPAVQPRLPSPFAFDGTGTPPFPAGGQGADGQDPMMAMLHQMMGGAGGPGAAGPQAGGLPPGLAGMFDAMQGQSAAEPSPDQSSAWLWRLVHSIFSLLLAGYIVLQTPFTGSKHHRTSPASPLFGGDEDWTYEKPVAETFAHFFYLFATFEVVLQSSRFFIERGQLQGTGILSTVAAFLPNPYGGYVRVIGRYSVIYSTVVSDAMVVVFVLGAASWWRGGLVA
ncbi:hypothetical protein P154DRAFT_424990 [Amniculicola lignicola CBS 123094]|uniref:GET complex, subunit GET2 n=1 Tax=Amniculicola lignicola CBS 123094 TaxID=1392246 RepID=A0A6A5X2B3_9PLEO|nr:hypothetical protein P154DRAFT_424990 [Amniculicola lignicola CBS 123094]